MNDDSVWRKEMASWPKDQRLDFEERAAIMEYDGNLSREEAERQAFKRIKHERSKT